MATRTITGTLHHADGTAWVSAPVRFTMEGGTFTVSPAVTFPQDGVIATTNSSGAFSATLTSGLDVYWRCALPDGDGFRFALPDGSSVTLETLRATASDTPIPITTYPIASGVVSLEVASGDAIDTDLADAIDALPDAGGVILIPAGTFQLSTQQTATKHVRLVGAGAGNITAGTVTPVTKLDWTGGATPMFYTNAYTTSWSFDGIHLDGNDLATYGAHIIAMQDQKWGVFSCEHCTSAQLRLEGSTPEGNVSFNQFEHLILHAYGSSNMLQVRGDGNANVCHNVIVKLHGGNSGNATSISWGDSDNNVVISTFIFQPNALSPIGWEWIDEDPDGGAARANYVWHLQAGNLTARTGTRNSAGWWDRENAQPEPTIEADAVFNYNQDIYGVYTQAINITNTDDTVTQFNVAGVGDNNIRGAGTNVWNALRVYSLDPFGYGSGQGVGGTVTQETNKSTSVSLIRPTGQITMHNANLAAGAAVSFTLSNATIDAGDMLLLNHISGGTAGAYALNAQCIADNATITVRNISGGDLAEAIVIAFAVVKGATT